MPRFLAAACIFLAGLMPFSTWALGLGEIDLKSALNQPFNAVIPLSSDSADEISGVKVALASSDTFARYGLDRPAFLSGFQFAVDGQAVRITSREPVTEPFVTLLLEIRWAQGRLLREYTVLLDPPVFAAEPPQPVAQAPVPAPPAAPPVVLSSAD